MKTDKKQDLALQTGKKIAAYFQDPAWRANWLRSKLEDMDLAPPAPPRTVKRKLAENGIAAAAARAARWVSKYPFLSGEAIDPIIKTAAEVGQLAKVLKAMSQGVETTPSAPSQFARHVIISMTCCIHIMEGDSRIPTKKDVRGGVESVFTIKKWSGFWKEDQRWTEVFNAAGLGDLPRGKCEKRVIKHGMHSAEKRIRVSRHRHGQD